MNFAAFLVAAVACPASTPAPGAPGVATVGKVPATAAMQLNTEGKQLYRQERWEEARQKYRAALAADPELLGAQLNSACSFSRQQRYAEAADEAAKLIRSSFVPWNREVHEAADLGILQDHPGAFAIVEAASAESGRAWGALALQGIPFVARMKPALRVTGQGVLVLGLNQEIFAWLPETNRFVQLTAEDGHVLAAIASNDGRRIAYVLGGKVVRATGRKDLLRGLSVRVLSLATMGLSKPVAVPGEVAKVQLAFAAQPSVRILGEVSTAVFDVDDGLHATSAPLPGRFVELTAAGVRPADRRLKKPCPLILTSHRDEKAVWKIRVGRPGQTGKAVDLDTRYDAGLDGLPFPDTAAADSAGKK